MEPHERLGEAMRVRTLDLKMKWVTLAAAAKISPEALRAIRRGAYRPSPITARALDEALQWPPGTIDSILDGGDPPPRPPGAFKGIGAIIEEIRRGPEGEELDPADEDKLTDLLLRMRRSRALKLKVLALLRQELGELD